MKRKAESELSSAPNSKTKRKLDSKPPMKEGLEEYRRKYGEHHKWLHENHELLGIGGCIFVPSNVDMKTFCGTRKELIHEIERLYANYGGDFNPNIVYSPFMLLRFGKDYALNARGIYYREKFDADLIVAGRKIWRPDIPKDNEVSSEILERQARARKFASHANNNELRCKSEYAWEADAWSDVFGCMREDPSLALDKHEYSNWIPDTDPILRNLTGSFVLEERIPDCTFGLATFTDRDADLDNWVTELHRDPLERLLLHPKYGLYADPKREHEPTLAFPFMVYEAKGWTGDCREARRQACSAAAFYLDMLDELARKPGPVGTPRIYQTKTSHHYQVFVLTSFGAYWHLLVGYRRPRLQSEHAGMKEMSDTIYVFQRIWSGYVTSETTAFELLSLIDQIHLWAITEHRTFVLEHLRAWHQLCDKNYLLEWKSIYDLGEHRKTKRVYSEIDDINVPSWFTHFAEPAQRNIQRRAKTSLAKALEEEELRKSKAPCRRRLFRCELDECTAEFDSTTAASDHLRSTHDVEEQALAQIKWATQLWMMEKKVEERQKRNIMVSGLKWPWPWPLAENDAAPEDLSYMDLSDPRYANWKLFRRTTGNGSGCLEKGEGGISG